MSHTPSDAGWGQPPVAPLAPPQWPPPSGATGYPPPGYGAPGYGPGSYYPGANYGQVDPPPRTSAMAVVALILSILWLGGVGSIVAVVLGFVARRRIKRSDGQMSGRGLSTAAIIIGFVGILGAIATGLVIGVVVHDTRPVSVAMGQSVRPTGSVVHLFGVTSVRVNGVKRLVPVDAPADTTPYAANVTICTNNEGASIGTNGADNSSNRANNGGSVIGIFFAMGATDGTSTKPGRNEFASQDLDGGDYFFDSPCETGTFTFYISTQARPTYVELTAVPSRYRWRINR